MRSDRGITATGAALGDRFHPKRNAVTALRLVLAVMVVWSHSWSTGGYHNLMQIVSPFGIYLGTLAVAGFFTLSGFLIAGSRERLSAPRFVWHRALRIFPGFWVCLIVTAVVLIPLGFGPVSWHDALGSRGSTGRRTRPT